MANGTIAFDTLQTSDSVNTNTTKSIDTSYIFNGVAKAWFRYQQSADNIHTSFNIASISDNSAGNYTPTYTNSFSSDDDVTIVSALHSGTGNRSAQLTSITASNFGGRSFNSTSATDLTVGFASLGDLA